MLYSFSLICVDASTTSQQASARGSNRRICMNHHATCACMTQLNNLLLIDRKMNIGDFYKHFGRDSTTNFQLERYARELKIPNFYVCMCDEINQLPRNKFPLNVIVNIHTSKERGVHWSALYINKDKVFFFDSYDLVPTQEIVDFLSQHSQGIRNTSVNYSYT